MLIDISTITEKYSRFASKRQFPDIASPEHDLSDEQLPEQHNRKATSAQILYKEVAKG